MKLVVSGIAMMAGLAWYLNGGSGGPDASREVAKNTALVYSEIAPLFPAGTTRFSGLSRDGVQREVVIETKKSIDRSIDYRMTLDGAEVMKMDLRFDPIADAASTKIVGDLDVDQALVRFAASQNGTEARHLPDFAVNAAMEKMVDDMADAIQEGRPLSKDMLFPLMRLSS